MTKGISIALDRIAGIFIVLVMVLVVSNIILRAVFNSPLKGTYEVVGLFTAVAVSLGLSYCAFQNGHIAVSFILQRFPKKFQSMIIMLTDIISFIFWGLAAWNLVRYAGVMHKNGLVTATSEIPIYPFVYVIALGFFALCLVIINKRIEAIREVVTKISKSGFLEMLNSESARKETI
jgi:TRAP-type C4-dicarboxylate transport system permease small subunit